MFHFLFLIIMKVLLNNKELQTEAQNIVELVEQLGLPLQGVAVAVAGKIVKRTEWAATDLTEGCQVTVIKAACGG